MSNLVLGVILCGVAVILAVLLYNALQEKKYRDEIRKQFGNANRDALVEAKTTSVRDGEGSELNLLNKVKSKVSPKPITEPKDISAKIAQLDELEIADNDFAVPLPNEELIEKDILIQDEVNKNDFEFASVKVKDTVDTAPKNNKGLLLNLADLKQLELSWFNPLFDYMAYISLPEAKDLQSMPRLSNKRRYRIAACATDGQFQLAEPIPGLKYQGFVIGLQAISRMGLATTQEIEYFVNQVEEFAASMNGVVQLTDIDDFLKKARPLDDLCARVDQIIAIHLMSREMIKGRDLLQTIQQNQFELSHDGAFYYPSVVEPLFRIVTLDESPFTTSLLSTRNYKGFSLLFDITKIPPDERNFNKFMDITIKLSSQLGLDLVNDNLEELSSNWLRTMGDFVKELQYEMKAVGIVPGEELAARLFA